MSFVLKHTQWTKQVSDWTRNVKQHQKHTLMDLFVPTWPHFPPSEHPNGAQMGSKNRCANHHVAKMQPRGGGRGGEGGEGVPPPFGTPNWDKFGPLSHQNVLWWCFLSDKHLKTENSDTKSNKNKIVKNHRFFPFQIDTNVSQVGPFLAGWSTLGSAGGLLPGSSARKVDTKSLPEKWYIKNEVRPPSLWQKLTMFWDLYYPLQNQRSNT